MPGKEQRAGVNIAEGLRLAVLAFLFGLLPLAAGSYAFGCFFYQWQGCSVEHGINWILYHPVYSWMIPAMTGAGFIVGAFGRMIASAVPESVRLWNVQRRPIEWIILALIAVSFFLWGLPDIPLMLAHRQ